MGDFRDRYELGVTLGWPDVARKRFETEAQVLARLQHPHIAKVFDAGQDSAGVPYIVMELLARAEGVASRVLEVELVAGQHAVIAIELIPTGVADSDRGERDGDAAASLPATAMAPPDPTVPAEDPQRSPRMVARAAFEWGSLGLGAVALGTAFALDVLAFRHARNLRDYDPGAVGFLNARLRRRPHAATARQVSNGTSGLGLEVVGGF